MFFVYLYFLFLLLLQRCSYFLFASLDNKALSKKGNKYEHDKVASPESVLYVFGCKTEFFFLSKQSQNSRTTLQDRSRSLGVFRKGKTCIIAKFQRTD